MNVQLTANPGTPRPSKATAERSHSSATSGLAVVGQSMRGRLALAAQDEHKWLAPGVFCLLAGWIILNSGWSTQNVGLPLMALGLILPLVPFIAQQRAIYEAERAQNAIAKSDTERNKMFRRGQVYELHSAGYSSPS